MSPAIPSKNCEICFLCFPLSSPSLGLPPSLSVLVITQYQHSVHQASCPQPVTAAYEFSIGCYCRRPYNMTVAMDTQQLRCLVERRHINVQGRISSFIVLLIFLALAGILFVFEVVFGSNSNGIEHTQVMLWMVVVLLPKGGGDF